MTLPREISPAEAAALVRQGAVLVDIREAPERREGAIPGSVHAPLSTLASARIDAPAGSPIIFHCKAGGRTKMNAEALKAKAGGCETYLLKGGIEEWRAAGLPVR
jgi:rhodanese-related sulfurtransferase